MKDNLGQHFLIDSNVLKRIGSAMESFKGKSVLEIGPGKGALTAVLISKEPEELTLIEKERHLAENLFAHFPQCNVVNRDIRDYQIRQDIAVGSIPYYISREITKQCVMALPESIYMVLQKEFAEKLTGEDISAIMVFTRSFYDTEILFDIEPESFKPVPGVVSSFIVMKRRKDLLFNPSREYWHFLTELSSKKRKAASSIGFEGEERIMHLTVEQIRKLYADKHLHTS